MQKNTTTALLPFVRLMSLVVRKHQDQNARAHTRAPDDKGTCLLVITGSGFSEIIILVL